METNELLFELSHSVRYEIMKTLTQGPLKLTKLGELVGANNPEVSRHLDRLGRARLAEKRVDGTYSVTSFGRVVMTMLPGLSFTASYPDYFCDHDLSGLPLQFLCRLGELSNCHYGEGTISNLDISRRISMEAKERLSLISMEIPADTGAYHSRLSEGMELRALVHERALDSGPGGARCRESAPHVMRVTSAVPVIMLLTESTAALMFPNHKGAFDFSAGFSSSDPPFMNWCQDLFEHLWGQGRPLSEPKNDSITNIDQ